MKTFLKTIGYILGAVLFIITLPLGIYTLVKHIYKKDYSFKKQFLPIAKAIAITLDQLANAIIGELLNDLLLKHKKNGELYHKAVKYGKYYHTISAITGVNYKRGVLNKKYGYRFNAMLDFVLGRKHSIKAINKCIKYNCKND